MESEVRLEVTRCIRTVTISQGDVHEALRTLSGYLEESCSSKAEFERLFYTPLLQALVQGLRSDWFLRMSRLQRSVMWDNFFLGGPPDQAVMAILDGISSSEPSSGLDHLVFILERFLDTGRLEVLLWSRCVDGGAMDSLRVKEVLLARLVALPSLTSNKLQSKTPSEFLPAQYYAGLANSMLTVLQKTCEALREGKDCSLGFVSHLLGKTCAQGHAASLYKVLVPALRVHTLSDPLWQRVSGKFLENVPDRWMESVVTGLVQAVDEPAALSRMMGSLVLKNQKAKLVVTHKLLLQQYHHPDSVLRTLLGYLAGDDERRRLLCEVLCAVCGAWSNGSAVRHTPVEQQLYVSKALLLAVSLLRPAELQEHQGALRQCMLTGLKCHLDSSVPRVRALGMAVGEGLSEHMDTLTQRLTFQYEEDDDTRALRNIMRPVELQPDTPEGSDAPTDAMKADSPPHKPTPSPRPAGAQPDSDLDSDDEPVPYDMSADAVKPSCRAPLYLRDCLDGLVSSEDAERVCVCLRAAEGLVRGHPAAARDLSADLTKVLLHMEDRFGDPDHLLRRQRAMVALAVVDPLPVAHYITAEFYALNYNLRQRLDMLEVIALAARELSDTPVEDRETSRAAVARVRPLEPRSDVAPWRHVVEERLKSKTKRLTSGGPAQLPPKATPTQYAPVAGHFFFPLLRNYDRPQATFDLLGGDHLVLGQLLSTLGLLMHLAGHAPAATPMGKALLDFVWPLRFHGDQCVRRGALMCVCAVLMAMPGPSLLEELSGDVLGTRAWLGGVAEGDPDEACRGLAVQALLLQERALKKGLLPDTQQP